MIPTGNVVVDILASDPRLARAAARNVVPINAPGGPDTPLPPSRPTKPSAAALQLPGPEPAPATPPLSPSAARQPVGAEAIPDRACPSGGGRTAIVIRVNAQTRSWESAKRTSHTQVVRPRCMRVATASTTPSVIGRRKLVLFDRPIAMHPSSATPSAVASEAIDSAIEAYTPP